MPGYSLGLVSGSSEGAAQIVRNLDHVARKGRLTFVEPRGFSALIENIDTHTWGTCSDRIWPRRTHQIRTSRAAPFADFR